MTKIFVDTNIYLDFYRTNRDKLSVFAELSEKAKGKLIFPEQVYKEFRRNRSNKILESKKLIDVQFTPPPFLGEQNDFLEKKVAYVNSVKDIKKLMDDMVKDPEKDPVFREVKNIYDQSTKIKTTQEIISKAEMRKKLGEPPVSKGKQTIGDEVIWECILSEVRDDVIIVSRDGTYTNDFDLLCDEFFEKTGKRILTVTPTISDGLKALGTEPSPELVEVEREIEKEREKDRKSLYERMKEAFGEMNVTKSEITYAAVEGNSVIVRPAFLNTFSECAICGQKAMNGARCMACGELGDF